MLHYENGGDLDGARQFFDHMREASVPFDAIGLSYYPWWHGGLDALGRNIARLRGRFDRDVVVVETAYPWSLGWWDGTHNVVGASSQLAPGYPATPAGQRAFLLALISRARAAGAAGVYYWEPAWVATPHGGPGSGTGWENVTLFDSTGSALPALRAFARGR
jgi:arabinogalactan endo-1,4-beta-galactosidase